MTTGRGLSACRLSATCGLFVRGDHGQWAEESDESERTPCASSRTPNSPHGAHRRPAISPRPVVVSCSLQFPGR